MLIKLIITIYLIGCFASLFSMADDLNDRSNVGFGFALIYILSRKESYNIILKSWYYLR